jgi:hypothetical protein
VTKADEKVAADKVSKEAATKAKGDLDAWYTTNKKDDKATLEAKDKEFETAAKVDKMTDDQKKIFYDDLKAWRETCKADTG